MGNGSRYLVAGGKKLLKSGGATVLRTSTAQPCCCADVACIPGTQIQCIGTVGICCCDKNATVSLTLPTITAAAGIVAMTYGPTVQAMIDAISGQTIELPIFPGNFCSWALYGAVTQVDCCKAFTWRVRVATSNTIDGYSTAFPIWLEVVRTVAGGRVAVGDAYPCESSGLITIVLTVANTSTAPPGDCEGPDDEDVTLDNVDADYIDDASLEVTMPKFSQTCGPTNLDGLPATLTVSLAAFFGDIPGYAEAVFGKTGGAGTVGISDGNGKLYTSYTPVLSSPWGAWVYDPMFPPEGPILDGTKRWSWECWVQLTSDPETGACCWLLDMGILYQEFDAGLGEWITKYALNRGQFRKCNRASITGTYTKISVSGPSTVEVA